MATGKRLTYASLLALLVPLCSSASAAEPAQGWIPGSYSPDWPHVVASPQEGQCRATPGYRFANDTPGDFTVVPAVSPDDGGRKRAGSPSRKVAVQDPGLGRRRP